MTLDNWHVIPNEDGTIQHYYGDLEYFIEDGSIQPEDIKREIPFDKLPATSYMELINDEYEDRNRHSMPKTILMINNILTSATLNLTVEQHRLFWQKYCKRLYAEND